MRQPLHAGTAGPHLHLSVRNYVYLRQLFFKGIFQIVVDEWRWGCLGKESVTPDLTSFNKLVL